MNSRQPAFYTFVAGGNTLELKVAIYFQRFHNGGHKEESRGCVGRGNALPLHLQGASHDSQRLLFLSVLILLTSYVPLPISPFPTQQTWNNGSLMKRMIIIADVGRWLSTVPSLSLKLFLYY